MNGLVTVTVQMTGGNRARVREAFIIKNRSKLGNHPKGEGGFSDFTLVFPNMYYQEYIIINDQILEFKVILIRQHLICHYKH